jgi:hypothetical protein
VAYLSVQLNDAASYYNAAGPGLGATFLDEIERAVKQVREHPEAAPLVNRLVRRKREHSLFLNVSLP